MSFVNRCRSCGSNGLVSILDLGMHFVSDFVSPGESGIRVPLILVRCNACSLVQLSHSVHPDKMYRHFWYQSGISSSMKSSLKDIAENAQKVVPLSKQDIFLDIGCNDGTLFDFFPECDKVGFEPALNLHSKNTIIHSYFNSQDYFNIRKARAKVITAIAMFYDLEDPTKFLLDVSEVLDDNGVFIIQQNYLGSMIENNCIDNICHEHLSYHSLHSMHYLAKTVGLSIFRAEFNDVNGGSFRLYLDKGKRKVESIVSRGESREKYSGLMDNDCFIAFKKRVDVHTQRLKQFLEQKRSENKKVTVLGASTRGNTLLQYSGITSELVDYAVDKNSEKWGLVTVGSNIPIVSRNTVNPDYFLLLPYHLIDEFMEQEKDWLHNGGKFIVPLPTFRIVTV